MTPISSATDAAVAEPASFVFIELAGQGYVLSVCFVREILDVPRIAPLPGAGPDVLGVIDVRGETIPVVDLAQKIGVSAFDAGDEARVLVLEGGAGGARAVGVVADRVLSVVELGEEAFEAPPAEAASAGLIGGVARLDGRLAYLLDVAAAIFNAPRASGGVDLLLD